MIAPTPDTTARTETAETVTEFAKWVIRESAFSGSDLDGGQVEEKAVELGLITETVYDPDEHGPSDVGEPGMPWFVFGPALASPQHPVGVREALEVLQGMKTSFSDGGSGWADGHMDGWNEALEEAIKRLAAAHPPAQDAPGAETVAWCQPMREGQHTPRVFVVRYEDQEVRDFTFDNEAEARAHWEKANVAWNCYLLASLPLHGGSAALDPSPPLPEEDGEVVARRLAAGLVARLDLSPDLSAEIFPDAQAWISENLAALVSALRERDEATERADRHFNQSQRNAKMVAELEARIEKMQVSSAAAVETERERAEHAIEQQLLNERRYQETEDAREKAEQDRDEYRSGWLRAIARAEKAEQVAAGLREAIKPFAEYMSEGMDQDHMQCLLPDSDGVGWVYLRHGDFRRARAAFRASTEEGKTATPSVNVGEDK